MSKTFKKQSRKGRPAKRSFHTTIPKQMARALGVEHKFYDTFAEGEVVSNAADMTGARVDPPSSLISTPAQGDGAQNRDGKLIIIDTIMISGVIQTPTRTETATINNSAQFPTIYIALVQDTQTNGANMLSEDCFTNPSNQIVLAGSPLKNLFNATRFNTLKVWEMDLKMAPAASNQTANTVSTAGQNMRFSGFLKVHIPVNFNGGTTAVVGSVSDNSLHMIAFNNVSLSFVEISYNARIRFTG